MRPKKYRLHLNNWAIPGLYAAAAIVAGLTFPRFESRTLSGAREPSECQV